MNVRPLLLLSLLMLGLLGMPGCGGCNWGGANSISSDEKKTDEETLAELEKRKKKLEEKPKDDFEPLAVRMLPSNDPSPSLKQPLILVKPGHWVAVSETAKTNNFDFAGELATYAEFTATNQPLEVEDTTSRLGSSCPAILAKGYSKHIEGMFYVPRRKAEAGRIYSLRSELRGVRTGRAETFNTIVSPSLRDYEHIIVVLASGSATPASYSHFDKLLSVKMPQVEATESETLRYYYIFRPSVEKSAPLPGHPLAWTTIAYVFWDDLDPRVLTAQQQQSLLDWLHWGGQLIISGPNSLDKLRGSFLSPYLPGEATQSVKLAQADFTELNKRFSLKHDEKQLARQSGPPKGENLLTIAVSPERPMLGVEMQLHSAATTMEGTGGLVVERRVGAGRIAVTRFPLTDVRIKQWKNFDGFLNSVLLRRPGRIFAQDNLAMLSVKWDDPALNQMLIDARLGSTLRYFTRDIAFEEDKWATNLVAAAPSAESPARPQRGRVNTPGIPSGAPVYGAPGFVPGFPGYYPDLEKVRPETAAIHPPIDDWHFVGYGSTRPDDEKKYLQEFGRNPKTTKPDPPGVAAWNDQGAASAAARQILTEAAGIDIPSADFVVKVLGVYLLVLVPLNWFVFWTIGKVEWAWIAAPVISLIGAGAVIRLAQLDIGFARSRNEVAVLEIQGGYERAHLTRYTALYTSLSSSYTLEFDEPTSLAAPFPSGKQDESLLAITNYTDVAFRRGSETALAGVQVSSNSTGMVHSEQLLSLGTSDKTLETLRLVGDETRGFSVSNTTDLAIRNVGVFRRVDQPTANKPMQPQIEAAYIEKLEPASSAILRFEPLKAELRKEDVSLESPPAIWLSQWDDAPIFSHRTDSSRSDSTNQSAGDAAGIRLTRLARLASDRLRLLPGDVRLVGWTDQRIPGMHIRPEAPQNRTYTLVLAHLTRGSLPPPRPDRNLAEDYYDPAVLEPEPDSTTPSDGIDRDLEQPAAGGT
ncbi:MAG TPA: hypothetical protein VGI40_06540 [Pirellulaceae bacterium]